MPVIPTLWGAEAGGLRVSDQPRVHIKTLSQKKKKMKNKRREGGRDWEARKKNVNS
jgi:hypothetical protein